jgi:hypothetical protein
MIMATNFLVIPSGFSEAAFLHTVPGQSGEVVVTCGFEHGPTFTQSDIDALSTAYAHMKASMPTVSRYEGCRVRVQAGAVGSSVAGSGAGANAGAIAPPNMSYVCKKTTATPGRQNQGRAFFPAVLREEVDGLGILTSGAYTAVQAAITAFVTDATSDWGNPVILHTFYRDLISGQVPRPDTTPTLVADFILEHKIGTQRTRLRP